jgi:hypothetical protein
VQSLLLVVLLLWAGALSALADIIAYLKWRESLLELGCDAMALVEAPLH